MATIRNPVEWAVDALTGSVRHLGAMGRAVSAPPRTVTEQPAVRRIALADLREALLRGLDDFAAYRTDVAFVCIMYPIVGFVLVRLAFRYDMLPLVFPLVSGFALVGPVVAVALYEMSRRRELGDTESWANAVSVLRSPRLGAIVSLGLMLLAIFLAWLAAAQAIYAATLGPLPPASLAGFVSDVLTTAQGWTMIAVGVGVGFLFAVAALAISVVSFPLLLDRPVGIGTAVRTSVRTVIANPVPMAAWGLIVAAALVIGSIPLLLGLIFVMPVLGHATWHLYRKVVV